MEHGSDVKVESKADALIEISTYAEPRGKWTIFVSNLPENIQESRLLELLEPMDIPWKSMKVLTPDLGQLRGTQAVLSFFTRADARFVRRYLNGLVMGDRELSTRYCVKQDGFTAKTTAEKELKSLCPFSMIQMKAPSETMSLNHAVRMTNYLLGFDQWNACLDYSVMNNPGQVTESEEQTTEESDTCPKKSKTKEKRKLSPGLYDHSDNILFSFDRESARVRELMKSIEEPFIETIASIRFPSYNVTIRGIGVATKNEQVGGPSIRRRSYYRAILDALRHVGYMIQSDWSREKQVVPVLLQDSAFSYYDGPKDNKDFAT